MMKSVVVGLLCLLAFVSCSPSAFRPWRVLKWKDIPFEFAYDERPAWCVDLDPNCSYFTGWCVSANEDKVNYMKKVCRRTCNLCYDGMNNTETCYDKEEDCAEREKECFSEATAKRMYHSCPKTCGYCNEICADLATNCADLVDYCTLTPWHQAVMRSKCRLTCSFCRVYDRKEFKPPTCYDFHDNCRYRRHACYREPYQNEMRITCAHTCNYCDYFDTVEDLPTHCDDAATDCESLRHLCYVAGEQSVKLWQQCQRTCGYCPRYYFENDDDDYFY